MPDIFLSYSSKDRGAADKIQQLLTARGYDVFWDQETPPGVDWDTWIRSKLTNCKAAIVLWSKASIASPNVRHEAIVARDAGKLIPAMIENLTPEDFPMGLYLLQGVQLQDWRNPDAKGMHRLLAEVETRLGTRVPGSTPKPATPAPRKINWIGVAIGVAGVAAATGLTQWYYSDRTPSRPTIDASCPNGLPRLSTGDCPALGASVCPGGVAPVQGTCPAPGPDGSVTPGPMIDVFSTRLIGDWTWTNGPACGQGPNIDLIDGRLVFATPTTRHVHEITANDKLETRTRVMEPATDKGDLYTLTPEFFATSDERSFNLVVENTTNGTRNVWNPCSR